LLNAHVQLANKRGLKKILTMNRKLCKTTMMKSKELNEGRRGDKGG
jgi:hypothetical protein